MHELFKIGRPQNALIPIVSFAIAITYYGSYNSNLGDILSVVGIVLFISMYATIQNDIEDYDIDKSNGRSNGLHGSSAISRRSASMYMYLLLIFSFVAMFIINDIYVWIITLLTILFVFAYNKSPFYLSRKPIASIVVMTVTAVTLPSILGLLMSSNTIGNFGALLVLALSAQRLSIIVLKDYKDVTGDALHGKQTFLLRYGYTQTKKVSVIMGILGYMFIFTIIITQLNSIVIALLFTIIYGFISYKNILTRLGLADSFRKANSVIFLKVIKKNYQADLLIFMTLLINVFF